MKSSVSASVSSIVDDRLQAFQVGVGADLRQLDRVDAGHAEEGLGQRQQHQDRIDRRHQTLGRVLGVLLRALQGEEQLAVAIGTSPSRFAAPGRP